MRSFINFSKEKMVSELAFPPTLPSRKKREEIANFSETTGEDTSVRRIRFFYLSLPGKEPELY